jgi:hypothetical protein
VQDEKAAPHTLARYGHGRTPDYSSCSACICSAGLKLARSCKVSLGCSLVNDWPQKWYAEGTGIMETSRRFGCDPQSRRRPLEESWPKFFLKKNWRKLRPLEKGLRVLGGFSMTLWSKLAGGGGNLPTHRSSTIVLLCFLLKTEYFILVIEILSAHPSSFISPPHPNYPLTGPTRQPYLPPSPPTYPPPSSDRCLYHSNSDPVLKSRGKRWSCFLVAIILSWPSRCCTVAGDWLDRLGQVNQLIAIIVLKRK